MNVILRPAIASGWVAVFPHATFWAPTREALINSIETGKGYLPNSEASDDWWAR